MGDNDPARQAAIERLEHKRVFRSHVVTYLAVNTMLVVIWAVSGAAYFWPIWPILGWGVAVGLHAWTVYGERPISEDDIRKEIQHHVPHDSGSAGT